MNKHICYTVIMNAKLTVAYIAGLIDRGIKALREFMQSIYGASGNDGLNL